MTKCNFPKSDVRDVARYYQSLTNKPVFIAIDLQALVTIELAEPVTRADAIELIRKRLLERYGIELRTIDTGETLIGWSKDPKYPRQSEASMTEAERNALPKRTIRVINPEPK